MSESAVLEAALNVMDTTLEMYSLIAAVDAALAVRAPAGDPNIIAAQAEIYGRVAHQCQEVVHDELAVKTKSLPASWHGQAAESATQALGLLTLQAGGVQEAFAAAAKTLASWADQLRTAQSQDAQGRELLVGARAVLSQLYLQDLLSLGAAVVPPLTRQAAISGCHDRWEAAKLVSSAADAASAALRPWPAQARAQQIHVPGVDALNAVTLAYYGGGSVLTPAAEMLASYHLEAMSAADRAAFEKLVADAKSPTEAEYLFKAASVGMSVTPGIPAYSLGQLQSFDAVIHPHGADPAWLHQHLDPGIIRPPTVSNFASKEGMSVSFDKSGMPTFHTQTNAAPGKTNTRLGQTAAALNQELKDANQALTHSGNTPSYISPAFAQNQEPYCVSDSAVMARLAADPALMLGVTTGQGPVAVSASGVKVGDDSHAAVAARAQSLFNQNYAYGRLIEHDAPPKKFLGITYQAGAPSGLDPGRGGIAVDDQLLAPVTGRAYEYQPLNDMADRQAALPKIEAAAQAGEPVPIGVASSPTSSGGHQMVIEGYQNGEFEIYNPWGFSELVPTKQFVDGQLGALTDQHVDGFPGGLPCPTDVELPQQ